jgi:Leucine-rich repeat (LRR) protein
MAATPRLQTLSAADLDGLILELKQWGTSQLIIPELKQQGTSQLIVLGPDVGLRFNPDKWRDDLKQASVVYWLQEAVPDLAQRLAAVSQLTFLWLVGTEIGAAGAASLAALTQLTSLNLWNNKIGDEGAAALAALTQLTSLNLNNNEIGAEGAASLAALTQLTSLNLWGNEIGQEGARCQLRRRVASIT